MCPNCGIKVSAAEESGCPGCGHIQSDSTSKTDVKSSNSEPGISSNSLKKNPFKEDRTDLAWAIEFLSVHVDQRKEDFENNPRETIAETEAKCLEVIRDAPNDESRYILNSYLSFLYIQMGRHKFALDAGLIGVKSREPFFMHQSFNSIFYAFTELKLNEEFKEWIEKARQTNFPDLAYHEINYFVNIGSLEEALAKCDEYSAKNPEWGYKTRASIYEDFGRFGEAEALYRKVTSRRATTPFYANSANSLAFAVLMPQGRFTEAEEVLLQALCSNDIREKINAYSNLAMASFHLKEYNAAKRYANVGASSHDFAIASESRLTLTKIESQQLLEDEMTTENKWDELVEIILGNLENTHFDDAAELFSSLVFACERSNRRSEIAQIIESQYEALSKNIEWKHNPKIAQQIEITRIDILSEIHLREKRFSELENAYIGAFEYLTNHRNHGLIEYLKNNNATLDFRKKCLAIENQNFIIDWAEFETDADILLKLTSHKYEPILLALAKNPATPDSALSIIIEENDLDLDFAVSTRVSLSKDTIQLLLSSNFETVRREIATRSDLEDSIYEKLATDSALLVRDAIRENPACSPELKALAALGSL
jgi:hypothetical protein